MVICPECGKDTKFSSVYEFDDNYKLKIIYFK